jgi:hypothetical protein
MFYQVISKVKELDLELDEPKIGVREEEFQPPSYNGDFPNLQILKIYRPPERIYSYQSWAIFNPIISTILKGSPNITLLDLNIDIPWDRVNEFNNLMSTCSPKIIKELILRGDKATRLTRCIAATLNSITMVSAIKIKGITRCNVSQPIVVNLSNSIQSLDLLDAHDVTGEMVQNILSGCPHLEVFKARQILDTDLVQVKPIGGTTPWNSQSAEQVVFSKDWVCLGLKTLSLFFDFNTKMMDTAPDQSQILQKIVQDHAFRQLSRLTMLESLNISGNIGDVADSLDLRLQSRGGKLEQLATLTKLKSFQCSSSQKKLMISQLELDWMESTWGSQHTFKVKRH